MQVHKVLLGAWMFSMVSASPFGFYHRADYMLKDWPGTNNNVPVRSSSSSSCSIISHLLCKGENSRSYRQKCVWWPCCLIRAPSQCTRWIKPSSFSFHDNIFGFRSSFICQHYSSSSFHCQLFSFFTSSSHFTLGFSYIVIVHSSLQTPIIIPEGYFQVRSSRKDINRCDSVDDGNLRLTIILSKRFFNSIFVWNKF